MTQVATIAHLGRYPVKSMRGQALEEAEIIWNGLLGDRRYAFVRGNTPSSFPWLTARQVAEYILFEPHFEQPPTLGEPEPDLSVRTPEGDDFRVDDPRLRTLLEQRFDLPLFLLHAKIGAFDSAHLSLFGLPTLRQLSGEVGRQLERERFRANFYLDTVEDVPFIEDTWAGRVLAIGPTVRIGVARRNVRCAMTTLDPATAESDPAVLRTIAQRHETCAGILASVIVPGLVRIGDTVSLVD